MKKGFTFQQIALLLLALIILVGLILIFLLQKDMVVAALQSVFGGGQKAIDNLDDAIGNLGVMILWRFRKQ